MVGKPCPNGCECRKHSPTIHSVETKEKIARSLRGRSPGEATRQRLRESTLEHWQDPEYREKQHDSRTVRWSDPLKRERQSELITMYWLDRSPEGRSIHDGYVYLSRQYGHPIATPEGMVLEHRMVLYDQIGEGPHECYWGCGKLLNWGGKLGLNVDHLDGDTLNNDPENLVPSCNLCNRRGIGRSGRVQ